MSLEMTSDNIYATKVLKILLTPFSEQPAHRLGLIDDNGNEIRKPKSRQEQDAYSPLFIVLFKVKQILNKLPSSQSRLNQIAVALQLIRQKNIPSQYKLGLAEDYATEYLKRLMFISENSLRLVEEETLIKKYLEAVIFEEGEGSAPSTMTTTAAIEPKGEPVIRPKKRKIEESTSFPTLYVSRPVLNRDDIVAWAKSNGIESVQDNLHTTICYSKTPVSDVVGDNSKLELPPANRSLALFGEEKDCLVLKVQSPKLEERWNYFKGNGATWSWPDYQPHITISVGRSGLDLSKIQPYTGNIVYGPEEFDEVEENWHDKATES
jgi:hypothetical protein